MPNQVANNRQNHVPSRPGVSSGGPLALAAALVTIWLFGGGRLIFQRLRVGDGRGDYVGAARPFPQINQTAALAAKRELRLRAQHNFAADGTAKAADALLGHAASMITRKPRRLQPSALTERGRATPPIIRRSLLASEKSE